MTFTLNEVMDAVKDAFGKVGGETARDCVVEQTIKETLSARPGPGKATEVQPLGGARNKVVKP